MPGTPSIDAVVDAILRTWARPGAVTDGFRLGGARAVDHRIEVRFRWRLDPQHYLLRFEYPGWIPEALGATFAASDAVTELGFWLMEELDTGFVGRAARTRIGDEVLLAERPASRSGWFVGRVPLASSPAAARRARDEAATTGEQVVVVASSGAPTEPIADPGRFLDRAGLDGAPGRAAVEDGSLIAWLQIDRGEVGSPRAGQAVVVRVDRTTARIDRLELRTDDPRALEDLALAACRCAIEQGAELLVADRDLRMLLSFGFSDDGARLVARYDEVRAPG